MSVWQKCKWELHILSPQLFNSMRVIWCRRATMSLDLSTVALQNATLSRRGSLRKSHCVATWLSKLVLLQGHGTPPSKIIQVWNSSAPPDAQLKGQKKIALMNLLEAPTGTCELLLRHSSEFGERCAFSEECFANKQILQSYTPRGGSRTWNRRLTVSPESFLLMMQYVDETHRRKLPANREKLTKEAMAEAAQMSALVAVLEAEVQAQGVQANLRERLGD